MKKQDDKIQQLNYSDEFLLSSAEKRFQAGNYLGALTMLNRRAELYGSNADACALYADVYEAMELYPMCLDAWFHFLDCCNEADFGEGYEGLAVAFMNLGNEFQSELYYRRAIGADVEELFAVAPEKERPRLRLVHSADGKIDDNENLHKGLDYLKAGQLDKAREALNEIKAGSDNFAAASGLTALCMLLEGNAEGAASSCRKLLAARPDDVSTLTTYCAVLGALGDTDGAKEIGVRLSGIQTDSTEELYRIATALCETGLDEEAYQTLTKLLKKLPNSEDALWFHAVAAYKTGREQEGIASLERLTTVYPKKAVAKYYLYRLRKGENVPLGYFYKLPEDEYKQIAAFLLAANGASTEDLERFYDPDEIEEYFKLVFDHLDGRDENLQLLAAKVAVRCHCDGFLRDVLLGYNVDESVKFHILKDLTVRNEEDTFGVVIYDIYREFAIYEMDYRANKRKQFMNAFAEVYSKYALISIEHERKIIRAADEIHDILHEAGATELFDETNALAAAIFREARLPHAEHSIERIAAMFNARLPDVKAILNYLL